MPDVRFMREALELARANIAAGGRPFGAVLVYEGQVVARGVNEIHRSQDPTTHAEMQVIRQASQALGREGGRAPRRPTDTGQPSTRRFCRNPGAAGGRSTWQLAPPRRSAPRPAAWVKRGGLGGQSPQALTKSAVASTGAVRGSVMGVPTYRKPSSSSFSAKPRPS